MAFASGVYTLPSNTFSSATAGVLIDPTDANTTHTDFQTAFNAVSIGTIFATVDVASAATCNIGAATTGVVRITGTTTITSLGTVANCRKWVYFSGALTLTYNATSLILPGAGNITTVAGDAALFISDASGNWRCLVYQDVTGVGNVTGPGSSTDLAVAKFNGTTGEVIQNTGVLIDSSQNLKPATNDTGALGTAALAWADADFASGAVMRFNNVDTITHSATLFTFSTPISVGTSNKITAGTIELGAASDTTLARVSAGLISVEGDTVALLTATQTLSGKTLTTPRFADLGFIADANGNELFILDTVTSAVNEVTFANAATGGSPTFSATGGDTNIDLTLTGKGTGGLVGNFKQATGLGILDSDSSHALKLTTSSNLTAQRTLTLVPGDADRTLTISASATVSQDYSSSGNPQFATIELGAASDTTLARSGAGVVTIEGVEVTTNTATQTLTNKTLTAAKIANAGFIADANGNELLIFTTTASAVNEITFANGATGVNPSFTASGETNVGMDFQAKGTGIYRFLSTASQASEVRLFEDTDDGSNYVAIKAQAMAASYTLTLPIDDGNANQFLRTDGAGALAWADPAGGGTVTNGANLTDNAVVRGDGGTTGVQTSSVIIDDSNNVSGIVNLTTTGTVAHGTSAAMGIGTIELGHASDTTIARVSAGVASIEGSNIILASAVAAQSDQETATSTTTFVSPGRQQYHPSAAKAWCYATVSGTNNAAYNCDSPTDAGTGDITINITTDFSSGNWAGVATVLDTNSTVAKNNTIAAGTMRIFCLTNAASPSLADPTGGYHFVAFGDQ